MILEATAYAVVFGIQRPGQVGKSRHHLSRMLFDANTVYLATNNPSPGLYICADADPAHEHWITNFWIIILVVESTLLSLSLYKGWQSHRSGLGGGLMGTLTRDSVLYFIA